MSSPIGVHSTPLNSELPFLLGPFFSDSGSLLLQLYANNEIIISNT